MVPLTARSRRFLRAGALLFSALFLFLLGRSLASTNDAASIELEQKIDSVKAELEACSREDPQRAWLEQKLLAYEFEQRPNWRQRRLERQLLVSSFALALASWVASRR